MTMHKLWLGGRGLLFILGLAAASLTGCKQSLGDRCQIQSDCEDGLTCVNPSGGSYQSPMGGYCANLAPVDMTGFPAQDMATPDLYITPPDLSPGDGPGDGGNPG